LVFTLLDLILITVSLGVFLSLNLYIVKSFYLRNKIKWTTPPTVRTFYLQGLHPAEAGYLYNFKDDTGELWATVLQAHIHKNLTTLNKYQSFFHSIAAEQIEYLKSHDDSRSQELINFYPYVLASLISQNILSGPQRHLLFLKHQILSQDDLQKIKRLTKIKLLGFLRDVLIISALLALVILHFSSLSHLEDNLIVFITGFLGAVPLAFILRIGVAYATIGLQISYPAYPYLTKDGFKLWLQVNSHAKYIEQVYSDRFEFYKENFNTLALEDQTAFIYAIAYGLYHLSEKDVKKIVRVSK